MCSIIKFSLKIHVASPLCSVVGIWLASPSNLHVWSKEMKRLVQDQRMRTSCWESRLLIKAWALDTKQLDWVPRPHNVSLSRFVLTSVTTDGTCHRGAETQLRSSKKQNTRAVQKEFGGTSQREACSHCRWSWVKSGSSVLL